MWSNIKKCIIRKCIPTVCCSWWSSFVPSTDKLVSTNHLANLIVQEVVAPELSKLNHAVMSKNKEIKCSFLQKKQLEKIGWIHILLSTYHTVGWIVLQNGLINSSILQEISSSVSKSFSCNGEKTELRWDKKNG